jgi:hypothetical protein
MPFCVNERSGVAVPDAPVLGFVQPLVSPSALRLNASLEFFMRSARSSLVIFWIGASWRNAKLLCAWARAQDAASAAASASRAGFIGGVPDVEACEG